MAEHDDQVRSEISRRILHTSDSDRIGNIAGHADGKDAAEGLIEDDLRRYTGIRAGQDDRLRRLRLGNLHALDVIIDSPKFALNEVLIAFLQLLQYLRRIGLCGKVLGG